MYERKEDVEKKIGFPSVPQLCGTGEAMEQRTALSYIADPSTTTQVVLLNFEMKSNLCLQNHIADENSAMH